MFHDASFGGARVSCWDSTWTMLIPDSELMLAAAHDATVVRGESTDGVLR